MYGENAVLCEGVDEPGLTVLVHVRCQAEEGLQRDGREEVHLVGVGVGFGFGFGLGFGFGFGVGVWIRARILGVGVGVGSGRGLGLELRH